MIFSKSLISFLATLRNHSPLPRGLILLLFFAWIEGCTGKSTEEKQTVNKDAKEALLLADSANLSIDGVRDRLQLITETLKSKTPVMLLVSEDSTIMAVQRIALADTAFTKNLFDLKSGKAFRNEIFNVYSARPQEVPAGTPAKSVFKVEMYNYALNLTTTSLVNINTRRVLSVNTLPQSQPDIPEKLKKLALQIAVNNPEVIKALGYKPGEEEALMSNTKTALNNTRCEQSKHLCVAPTFIKGEKALWTIVDLTEHRVVGIRWTYTGTTGPVKRISERNLKFDKIMECYCQNETAVDKMNWKFNFVLTTSDGMRISEVYYQNRLVINSAKIVDWHVSYSNTDGFGYSDAVGCPEFSQAAVLAVTEPRITEIIEHGKTIGFALEQNFNSEQWPLPCNYNYLQRYEFYLDGRFRPIAASLGRGCGNNGTYRPVTRIAFAGSDNTWSEWQNEGWKDWTLEKWALQDARTRYTKEGYQYKISNASKTGFFLEPGQGQFADGGRGDNAYVYITRQHVDRDEGENDLVTIGPCCNTDYRQGPEKFIEPAPESIRNTALVVWYVPQMKNDDTKGHEYCWAESYLDKGVYKTKVFPCLSGPMFTPFSLKQP